MQMQRDNYFRMNALDYVLTVFKEKNSFQTAVVLWNIYEVTSQQM